MGPASLPALGRVGDKFLSKLLSIVSLEQRMQGARWCCTLLSIHVTMFKDLGSSPQSPPAGGGGAVS